MDKINSWLQAHPWWGHLWVVVESAAFGTAVDAFTSGFDFTGNGLKHLSVIVGTAVAVAVRNYIKQSPLVAGNGTTA